MTQARFYASFLMATLWDIKTNFPFLHQYSDTQFLNAIIRHRDDEPVAPPLMASLRAFNLPRHRIA